MFYVRIQRDSFPILFPLTRKNGEDFFHSVLPLFFDHIQYIPNGYLHSIVLLFCSAFAMKLRILSGSVTTPERSSSVLGLSGAFADASIAATNSSTALGLFTRICSSKLDVAMTCTSFFVLDPMTQLHDTQITQENQLF
jgi:hypothetical protein